MADQPKDQPQGQTRVIPTYRQARKDESDRLVKEQLEQHQKQNEGQPATPPPAER